MGDDRRAMYDGFSTTGAHSMEFAHIANVFVNQAFASGCTVVKCPCSKCKNRLLLHKPEIQLHIAKDGFILPGVVRAWGAEACR